MDKRLGFLLLLLSATFVFASDQPKIPPLPVPLTNNAVTAIKNGIEVYSVMGIGKKRTWDDISNKMYILPLKSPKWREVRPVPGVAGRLGASIIGARGQVFVFGGYTVDGRGEQLIVGDVNSYLPGENKWYRAADIPVPVDRAVIGVDHDRYIYLVGGRSRTGPVNIVQIYDAEKNLWSEATPFPGTPVFGHAGGLIDETIVFVNGVNKKTDGTGYAVSDECWIGRIDHKDPEKIEWSKLPAHPGWARFGIVGGGGEHRVWFSGGTATIHDYTGASQDGKPLEISPLSFVFDLHSNRWDILEEDTSAPRADTRGLAFTPLGPLVIGGTEKDGGISGRVSALPKK